MPEERRGLFTEDQQNRIEKAVKAGKFEAVDGIAINLIDNYGLEAAKQALLKKYPDLDMNDVYGITDTVFDILVPVVE